MATRSIIVAQCADGKFRSIYCHFDGYPEGVGRTLVDYYADQMKIDALMALGSLSQLAPSVYAPEGHTYKNPVEGHCIAFHRDSVEDFSQGVGDTPGQAIDDQPIGGWQYCYVWVDGVWNLILGESDLVPVQQVLDEEED